MNDHNHFQNHRYKAKYLIRNYIREFEKNIEDNIKYNYKYFWEYVKSKVKQKIPIIKVDSNKFASSNQENVETYKNFFTAPEKILIIYHYLVISDQLFKIST